MFRRLVRPRPLGGLTRIVRQFANSLERCGGYCTLYAPGTAVGGKCCIADGPMHTVPAKCYDWGLGTALGPGRCALIVCRTRVS